MPGAEPPIMLDLDPAGYIQGLGEARQETDRFGATLRTAAVAMGPMAKAMDSVTPKRATLAAMVGFSAIAAKQQGQLSGLAASSKVTGTNFGLMTSNMRQMARELPVGNRGALEMTTTLARMGVVSTGNAKQLNNVSKAVQSADKAWGQWDKNMQGTLPGIGKVTSAAERLLGNKGTLTSGGAEKRISDLGKTFIKLGGATGEGATGLATGMVMLNRTMGTKLNTKNVEALSDSLTTISAQSGASATGILQFSKAIAPMAQASGIGQTQVMGISAAFAKLGDDGFAGANAFSKMMSDLNRSAREGTPQMAAYAQIAGKTTKEFKALYEANPAEALTQVVEAIGSSGNAPRMLEQIGLEGVRTARVLTNLAQAGDLRGEISRSVGAFGNGSTEAASQAAFGGLNDSLVRLGENAEQVGGALGRPFLNSITMVTDAMGAMLSPIRAAADSSIAQGALGVAAPIGLGALALKSLIGPLVTATGIGQVLSSGPVRAGLGGYAASGAPLAGLAGRLGGNRFNERVEAGLPTAMGRMQGIVDGTYSRAAGFGGFMRGMGGSDGPSLISRISGAGVVGTSMYMRMIGEQARLARTPQHLRASTISDMGNGTRQYMEERERIKGERAVNRSYGQGYGMDADAARAARSTAFTKLTADAGTAGSAIRILGGAAAKAGGQLALTGLSGLGRGAAGALSMVGGPWMAGAMALGGVGMAMNNVNQNRKNDADEARNASSWIDDYRIAMGKATEATSTFAGSMTEAAKTAGGATMSMGKARGFNAQEEALARAAGGDPVRDYSGGVDRAVQKISMQIATSGLKPDELNRVQQDLLNSGYSGDKVRQITDRLPADMSKPEGAPDAATFAAEARGIAGQTKDRGTGGYKSWADMGGALNSSAFGWIPGVDSGDSMSSGLTFDTTSKKSKQDIKDLSTAIMDASKATAGAYGTEVGDKAMFDAMDASVKAALDAGDTKTAEKLINSFQGQLGTDTFGISRKDLERNGFSAFMAGKDENVADRRKAAQGADGKPLTRAENWTATQIGAEANPLASWFSNKPGANGQQTMIQKAVDALVGPGGSPEDPTAQTQAMEAAMTQANRTGMTMSELATNALRAANGLGNAADVSFQFATAVRAAALQQEQRQGQYLSSGDAALQRGDRMAGELRQLPTTAETKAERDQLMQGHLELESEAKGRITQRLTQAREQQVQMDRMEEQYGIQQTQAREDYQRSIDRSQEQFNIGRVRQQEQFQITIARSQQQYALQHGRAHLQQNRAVERATHDYHLSVRHATEDFHRSQLYSQRDFNKSMKRAAEDGARAMYDPYQRIQVQQVWDAQNLLGNLEEQNRKIAEQSANLNTARSMGMSNNTIQMLGLNDPKNAQQLQQIIDDMLKDPGVVGALNRAGDARAVMGTSLATDASNLDRQRAEEDFRENARRTAETFAISLDRQGEAFRLQTARGRQDFATAMSQMAQDNRIMLRQATADNARSARHAREDNEMMLRHAGEDRERMLERSKKAYNLGLRVMREDIKRADTEIVGDIATLTNQMNMVLSGQRVNFEKNTVSSLGSWVEILRRYSKEWEGIILGMGNRTITIGQANSANPSSARGAEQGARGGPSGTGGPGGFGVVDVGRVTSEFGPRGGRMHSGIDIGGNNNAPIKAYTDGIVTVAGSVGGYGNAVYIDHGRGNITRYGHMSRIAARRGQEVARGEVIGYVGSTGRSSGPHLHFETRPRNVAVNPRSRPFATGGIATRPLEGLVAEAGQEGIIPLNKNGAQFMADVMTRFVSKEEARGVQTSGGTTYITYDHSRSHYDHRVIIEKVDLKAESPRELAAAAAAEARRNNLTAPPQRRNR